jgi:hypothetical protein
MDKTPDELDRVLQAFAEWQRLPWWKRLFYWLVG